jgi:hypothetical protein
MTKRSEKILDKALDKAFQTNPRFAEWFLAWTVYATRRACPIWSRSDHPWGSLSVVTNNPATGVDERKIVESETDVLVVFESADCNRFALHIENKLANGQFRPSQPEYYKLRAQKWLNNPKYGNYSEFQTVLVAPQSFINKWRPDANKYDTHVTLEDIALYIPEFAA